MNTHRNLKYGRICHLPFAKFQSWDCETIAFGRSYTWIQSDRKVNIWQSWTTSYGPDTARFIPYIRNMNNYQSFLGKMVLWNIECLAYLKPHLVWLNKFDCTFWNTVNFGRVKKLSKLDSDKMLPSRFVALRLNMPNTFKFILWQ